MSYPLPGYRFAVSLDPVDAYMPPDDTAALPVVMLGAFSAVSGLSGELEVLAQPEGGQNNFVHQLPTRYSWGRITLKKGVVRDRTCGTGSSRAQRRARRSSGRPHRALRPRGAGRAHVGVQGGPRGEVDRAGAVRADGAIAVETLEIVHQGLDQVIEGGG